MPTMTINGTNAIHTIRIHDVVVTDDNWRELLAGKTSRYPQTGAAALSEDFVSVGNALSWLVRSLRGHGWPRPTEWDIYPTSTGRWGVYLND